MDGRYAGRRCLGLFILAILLSGVAGCGVVEDMLRVRKPSARIVDVRLKGISLSSVTFVSPHARNG